MELASIALLKTANTVMPTILAICVKTATVSFLVIPDLPINAWSARSHAPPAMPMVSA